MDGLVLAKYAEENEMTATGKPIFKMANLQSLILRAYVAGNQLTSFKLGQTLQVRVDDNRGGYKTYEGVVAWVSDRAEFPQNHQTKEERANLVYAIKVTVKNDGFLKIGMYGEVVFKIDSCIRRSSYRMFAKTFKSGKTEVKGTSRLFIWR